MNLFKKGMVVFTAVPLLMSSSMAFAQDNGQEQSNNISDQYRTSIDAYRINMNENKESQESDSIADLQKVIKQLAEAGEIDEDGAANALLLHLNAVNRYAKLGQVKKVVKHMKGFEVLLKEQLKKKVISQKAYNNLYENSTVIIDKYAVTQPVFSYENAIREKVYVETNMDSDMDGKPDKVAVDIIRPRETGNQIKVPVIMDASPYYESLGRGNESELKEWDKDGKPIKFPLYYDNYFVPRGYAVVLADMIGTSQSDGCPTTGGIEDINSIKAVVDWLNGRAKAKTSDGKEVIADWTNGKVGMIGKSYDGTLANGVAATGVEGLETIVPISAISSWYDYYRYSGIPYYRGGPAGLANTVVSSKSRNICKPVRDRLTAESDDNTGNYNHFWDKRNYYKDASKVKASVFAIHGLNDYNVKTNHFSQWWDELEENDVPKKAVAFQNRTCRSI
ncbi:CocE/NonD family hydrolase [Virgibacillus halophilus]|uniref:CocE/NonD family hydrolase n=1 Tax=Tigheibacillus halophilus TaxID=361280 RepID=A0ABU5C327_9BACI|nr:CocE/NonD family hydrolase [Virgibacillus halophilus]